MLKPETLKAIRLTHLYYGVFVTPALLFFALTGALQTFGLHESNRDHPEYKPAHWIVVLAQIHKKQTPVVPVKRVQATAPAAASLAAGAQAGGEPAGREPAGGEGRGRRRGGEDGVGASGSAVARAAQSGGAGVAAAGAGVGAAAGAGAVAAAGPVAPVAGPIVPAGGPAPAVGAEHHPLPLRIFFLIVSVGLFSSTLTGLAMAYMYTRNKRLVTLALVLGVVIPLVLVAV